MTHGIPWLWMGGGTSPMVNGCSWFTTWELLEHLFKVVIPLDGTMVVTDKPPFATIRNDDGYEGTRLYWYGRVYRAGQFGF